MSEEIKYLSAQQMVDSDSHPLTMGQMRHYLMFRHKNGLASEVSKIDKRLFLRIDLFNAWIEKQAGGQ